jgi:hypothetical protein
VGLTKHEMSALLHAVKRSHWNPRIGVALFLQDHLHIEPTPDIYALAVGVGRTPFPNIKGLPEGPFPLRKEAPWWDGRMWQSPEQSLWERRMEAL